MIKALLRRIWGSPSADPLRLLERELDQLLRVHGYGMLQTAGVPPSPVAHLIDPPLKRKTFWVKQINSARLTELGRSALLAAFTGYADHPEIETARRELEEASSRRLGVGFKVDQRTQRRYSGDHTLPRGRYYAMCDETGDDQGTLVGELRAYYSPAVAGIVRIYDCTLPGDLERVRALDIPAGNNRQLIFGFPPVGSVANPFAAAFASVAGQPRLAEVLGRKEVLVGLPLSVMQLTRDRVLDLREPDAAEWFTRMLTTLEWRLPDGAIRCFPSRPPLTRFQELLPELLTQENGGGGITVAAGVMLRHLGADGVMFPSARSDARAGGDVGDFMRPVGWNFVDFAEAGPPEFFAWIEHGRSWPDQIGFRPYADAPAEAAPVWYPEVRILGEGSAWRVEGLRRRTDLRWRIKLMTFALDCHRGHLTERTWGTLRTFPELLESHGHIEQAGMLAMLIFDAAMGSLPAASQLKDMFPADAAVPDLAESVNELVAEITLPAQEHLPHRAVLYVPWQGD